MSAAKLVRLEDPAKNGHVEYVFHCPGCKHAHSYVTHWGLAQLKNRDARFERKGVKPAPPAPMWSFNGDMERPTFKPSLLYDFEHTGRKGRCHLFVTDGQIQFCGDCTHELAGKAVPMEPL